MSMFQRTTKMDDQFSEQPSWHAIRPGYPSLSLYVREITSVSVTFVLSSPYSAHDPDVSLASLGLSSSDDEDEPSTSRASTSLPDSDHPPMVTDIISNGFSVKVNGTPWRKVIVPKDDIVDEAIIIVHGLMPARQYDVELGIMPGESTVRGQITTDPETLSSDPSGLPASAPEEAALSSPESSSAPLSLSSSSSPPHHHALSHSHSHSNGHSPHHSHSPPFTLEDRRLQLTKALSQLNAEHSSLTTALKTARRESQKADAALRAEIDALKRAADRHAAGESRARKKVLALQEAAKQTLAAARDIEALVTDIEAARPALEQRKREVEREWEQVRGEAERVRVRREEAEGREKARAEAGQQELAVLASRLDKLNGKREKLEGEGGVIGELEERLRKLEEERERVEKDPYGYEGDAGTEDTESVPGVPGPARSKDEEGEREKPPHVGQHGHPNAPHHNFHPGHHPRKRHSHPHVPHHPNQHHHPRPSFPPPRGMGPQHQDPIHRPSGHRASYPAPGHPAAAGLHLPQHGQHPHKSHGRNFRAQQMHGSSSSSSASSTPAAAGGSMLSSRALPFEPGRHRSHSSSQAVKSDLNPGSTPFAPRSTAAQAVASVIGAGAGAPS